MYYYCTWYLATRGTLRYCIGWVLFLLLAREQWFCPFSLPLVRFWFVQHRIFVNGNTVQVKLMQMKGTITITVFPMLIYRKCHFFLSTYTAETVFCRFLFCPIGLEKKPVSGYIPPLPQISLDSHFNIYVAGHWKKRLSDQKCPPVIPSTSRRQRRRTGKVARQENLS